MARPLTLPEVALQCLHALASHELQEVLTTFYKDFAPTFWDLPSSQRLECLDPVSSLLRRAPAGAKELLICFPEDLQCSICFSPVLEDGEMTPMACSEGHLLCKGCSDSIPFYTRPVPQRSERVQKCPTCASQDGPFRPQRFLRKLAAATPCRCPNQCGQVLTHGTRLQHVGLRCDSRLASCPGCARKLAAKDLLRHLTAECQCISAKGSERVIPMGDLDLVDSAQLFLRVSGGVVVMPAISARVDSNLGAGRELIVEAEFVFFAEGPPSPDNDAFATFCWVVEMMDRRPAQTARTLTLSAWAPTVRVSSVAFADSIQDSALRLCLRG